MSSWRFRPNSHLDLFLYIRINSHFNKFIVATSRCALRQSPPSAMIYSLVSLIYAFSKKWALKYNIIHPLFVYWTLQLQLAQHHMYDLEQNTTTTTKMRAFVILIHVRIAHALQQYTQRLTQAWNLRQRNDIKIFSIVFDSTANCGLSTLLLLNDFAQETWNDWRPLCELIDRVRKNISFQVIEK